MVYDFCIQRIRTFQILSINSYEIYDSLFYITADKYRNIGMHLGGFLEKIVFRYYVRAMSTVWKGAMQI